MVLTVYSGNCTKTITKTQYITVAPIPVVDFTAIPDPTCLGTTSQFINNTTITNGSITNWQWNLGDGTTSTIQQPTHTYTNTGTYTISLVATSDQGCMDSTTATVQVHPAITVSMTQIPDTLCIGTTETLVGTGAATYDWYADGTLICNDCASVDITPTATTTYMVIGTAASGCTDTATQAIVVSNFVLPQLQVMGRYDYLSR